MSHSQQKQLRRQGQKLKPIVRIGHAGITVNVLNELEQALEHHELVKLKAQVGDRDSRDAVIAEVVGRTGAELVQQIGNVAVLYRSSARPSGSVTPKG